MEHLCVRSKPLVLPTRRCSEPPFRTEAHELELDGEAEADEWLEQKAEVHEEAKREEADEETEVGEEAEGLHRRRYRDHYDGRLRQALGTAHVHAPGLHAGLPESRIVTPLTGGWHRGLGRLD